MPKPKGRRFGREVKLAAVKRMLAGENVRSLAKQGNRLKVIWLIW